MLRFVTAWRGARAKRARPALCRQRNFGRTPPRNRRVDEANPSNLPQSKRRKVQLVLKRWVDVVCSSVGLLALSPLLVAVAALVKLTSPGPVFFSHGRERRGGKEFGCIKFRTMCEGAEGQQEQLAQANEVDGPQFKLRNDPRVTRLGAWLRKTNIDELPQLFNVLAGAHEPGWTTTFSVPGEPDLCPLAASAIVCAAGDDWPLADLPIGG